MTTGQRILFNALATYGRTLLAIFLGLFSSRWILASLGEIDYGLMGVVGGILVFITFINVLSLNATSRFYAFSIGQNDVEETRRWFNTALSFELILPPTLIIIGYFIGDYAVNNFLSIPPERLDTARWVFRFSLFTALVTMSCSPFMAMYTAKQNIAELSFWGMGLSITSFVFAYILTCISGDHWLIFSAGTSIITCSFCIMQSVRSYCKYAECKIVPTYMFNKKRLKEMVSYSCWTLFGTLGGIFQSMGTGIVLNKFFPPMIYPSVNASYSVGSTITSHTSNISGALVGAFTPEIVSSEGRGDHAGVVRQMFRAGRLSYIVLCVVVFPIFFGADFILKAWLGNPPEYASLFCRTLLIAFLIKSIVNGFNSAIAATGRIRNYQIIMASCSYLSIGVSVLLLTFGGGLYCVCGVLVGYNIIDAAGNVYFCKKLVGISVKEWLRTNVLPIATNLGLNIAFGLILCVITDYLHPTVRFFLMSALLICFSAISSWKLLIEESEKSQCKNLIRKIKFKVLSIVGVREKSIGNVE